MNIPEKLKLNKFRNVVIPRTKNLFSRFGLYSSPANMYTGENEVPENLNKVEEISRSFSENNRKSEK